MRRLQVFILLLPLLATPGTLLAWNCSCHPSTCMMACCQGRHGMVMRNGMMLKNGHWVVCHCMKQNGGPKAIQTVLLLPPPPLELTSCPRLEVPGFAQSVLAYHKGSASPGFALLPFEPPRA